MPANKSTNINLLPQNDLDNTTYGRIIRWLLTTFRFIVITVELIVIVGFLSRFWLDTKNADLDEEINQKKLIIESFSEIEEEFRDTQAKLAKFSEFSSQSHQTKPVLDKIFSKLPPDISLEQVDISQSQITLTALTTNEASIAQLISNLGTEAEFAQVELASVQIEETSPVTRFIILIGPET